MRNPDRQGSQVRAWNITRRIPELADDELQRQAGRALWLLHVPWAHPFWSWYVLALCLEIRRKEQINILATAPRSDSEQIVLDDEKLRFRILHHTLESMLSKQHPSEANLLKVLPQLDFRAESYDLLQTVTLEISRLVGEITKTEWCLLSVGR